MTSSDETDSRRRDVLTVAIVAIIAMMVGVNLFMLIDDGGGDEIADGEAPGFELPVMETDETVRLDELRGQVVLIDFWATWCPPCRDQMPALESVAHDPEYADDIEVLWVNVDPQTDDRRERIREFLDDEELTLPTLIDDGTVQGAYGAGTLPTLVVVDPEGQVAYVSEGVHDEQKLRDLIDEAAG